jgi:hypothetical protein
MARHICLPPSNNKTTTFVDSAKSCIIPESTRMRSTAFWNQVHLFVHPSPRIVPVALWNKITTYYTSVLIVGLSPNLRNSLSMISRTSSALSGVVRMESWIVPMKVPGISARIFRQMMSIISLLS